MATNLNSSERARLESALAAVCGKAGISTAGAKLVRYTMNAVYRIDAAGVVIRMATGPNAAALVSRVAQVASAFADLDLPTTRLAPDIRQPVHVDGWSATIWVLLPQPEGHRFAPVELAAPLRAIHAVSELPFELPAWGIIEKARRRVAQVQAGDQAEMHYLHEWASTRVGIELDEIQDRLMQRCDELTSALHTVKWTLPPSVIHGDAHAGNLLSHPGRKVMIGDLDSVAIGPPEWDLIPAAHGAIRFGDNPAYHKRFASAYGIDVTTCPAWDTLRQIRELQLVTSVIANIPGRPDVANELAHRLRTSLANDTSATWHRYR